MAQRPETYSIVPEIVGGHIVYYPLSLNILRAMPNPIGMLYGKVRDNGTTWHHGWDLYAEPRTPVYCIDSGTVEAVWSSGDGPGRYGKQVVVRLDNLKVNGKVLYFHVAHLDGWIVQKGQKVPGGQMLGWTGTTGNADISSPHLHFELRFGVSGSAGRVNPADIFPELYNRYLHFMNLSPHVLRKW